MDLEEFHDGFIGVKTVIEIRGHLEIGDDDIGIDRVGDPRVFPTEMQNFGNIKRRSWSFFFLDWGR